MDGLYFSSSRFSFCCSSSCISLLTIPYSFLLYTSGSDFLVSRLVWFFLWLSRQFIFSGYYTPTHHSRYWLAFFVIDLARKYFPHLPVVSASFIPVGSLCLFGVLPLGFPICFFAIFTPPFTHWGNYWSFLLLWLFFCHFDLGDGKVFVSTVEDAVRIRTGERGDDAIAVSAE